MEKFKYKFQKYVYFVLAGAILLAALCIILQTIRIVKGNIEDTYGYVGAVTTIAIGVLIIVLVTSIMLSSCYVINEKNLVLKWGLLKNEIPLEKITGTIYNSDTKKLIIEYNEDNYMYINLSGVEPLDFVDALRKKNKKIAFQSVSEPPKDDADTKN